MGLTHEELVSKASQQAKNLQVQEVEDLWKIVIIYDNFFIEIVKLNNFYLIKI